MILMGFPAVPLRRELVEDDDMSAIAARRCGGYPHSALSNQARVLWILLVSRESSLGKSLRKVISLIHALAAVSRAGHHSC
jgi:hypothetical protein